MKVLLIQPGKSRFLVTPPLGPAYLAAVLEREGIPVRLVDLFLERLAPDRVDRLIAQEQPDIVGVSTLTTDYPSALTICRRVKRTAPETTTVLGGPHISALPRVPLRRPSVDSVIMGEGELTMLELASGMDPSTISGLGYRGSDGSAMLNPPRAPIEPLDSLPYPAWHHTPLARYPLTRHGGFVKRAPVVPVITSRGCPYRCTYCASNATWGRSFRARRADAVVDELAFMRDTYGAREAHIEDDNLTLDRRRAMRMCELMIERDLDMPWVCPNGVRADTLDRELLDSMHRAGCHALSFGIESGNQHILDRCNKSTPLETTARVVATAHSVGITTTGFFILGLPGETPQTVARTIRFAKRLALDRIQVAIFVPFPGCAEFERWIEEEEVAVDELEFDQFTISHALYETSELDAAQLIAYQKRMMREFYLRPRILARLLRDMHLRQIPYLVKRIREFGLGVGHRRAQ